jgi:DNA-binding NarL/FixJ family response regulator
MSASISSALSTASVAAANFSSNAARTPQPQRQPEQQPTVNNTGYTLQLSEAQQVYQLYNQGQGIPQIATALNLSVSVIDNYLGITNGGS